MQDSNITTYDVWCCLQVQMLDLELLSSENLASISAEQPAAENTAMLYITQHKHFMDIPVLHCIKTFTTNF